MAENTEQVTVSLAVDLGNWGSGFAKAKNDLDNYEDKLKPVSYTHLTLKTIDGV